MESTTRIFLLRPHPNPNCPSSYVHLHRMPSYILTSNIHPLFHLLATILLQYLNTWISLYFSNTLVATFRLTRGSFWYYAHTVRFYTIRFRRHRFGVTRIGPPLSRPFVAGPYYFRLSRQFLFIYLFLIVVQRRRQHRRFCSSFGRPSVLYGERCASPSSSRATPKRLRDRTRFLSSPFVPFVLPSPRDDLCRLCRRR